jgi:SAM-dependent methyltransferase
VTRAGIEVTAVEPDPGMLAELRERVPGATALAGTAEHIPLPDEMVDAVLVGQAFHWFDKVPALTEIARVLRPGGVLGVLANREDDRVEWVAGYRDVTAWARMAGSARNVAPIPEHPAYAPMERLDVANPERITAEQLIARLGTYSWISTLPEARRRAVVERSRAYLAGRPELAVAPGATFELPLVTAVARLVRLDGRR